MTATNLTSGRPWTPDNDPITEGWRLMFRAMIIRAALDLKNGNVPEADEGPAYEFLAMPATRRLAEAVGLLPGEGGR